MKANRAPEKIWIDNLDEGFWFDSPSGNKSIEYARTDAFIEKACEFMRNHIDPQLTIYHEQTWCKRDEFIKKFCKYMKGE